MNNTIWPLPNNSRGLMPFTPQVISNYAIDDNDIGAPNIRPRSTKVRVFHTFYMAFTDDEWETVKSWVHSSLHDGIKVFQFPQADNWTSDISKWKNYRFAIEQMNNSWYDSITTDYNFVKVRFVLELMNG